MISGPWDQRSAAFIFIPTSHNLKTFLQGACVTFITIMLFDSGPRFRSHCIKRKRVPMSSEVNSLILSHTASITQQILIGNCSGALLDMEAAGGTDRQVDYTSQLPCSEVAPRGAQPGNVRPRCLLGHAEPSLFFFSS